MKGSPEKFGWVMAGSVMSAGSCWRMRLTASRTSLRAVSELEPITNSQTVVEAPSVTVEKVWSRPEMPTRASSTLRVTSVSSSVGLAPGWPMLTTMIGKSMLGLSSTPSWK
ncbi:hypothetical protein D3C72_765510 [compost metagenome]